MAVILSQVDGYLRLKLSLRAIWLTFFTEAAIVFLRRIDLLKF